MSCAVSLMFTFTSGAAENVVVRTTFLLHFAGKFSITIVIATYLRPIKQLSEMPDAVLYTLHPLTCSLLCPHPKLSLLFCLTQLEFEVLNSLHKLILRGYSCRSQFAKN